MLRNIFKFAFLRMITHIIVSVVLSLLIIFSSYTCYGEIVVGPYIQNVNEKSAVICWRSSKKVKGIVRIGKGEKSDSRVINGKVSTKHEILVDNLRPGTLYYYQVISGNDKTPSNDRSYFFRTTARKGEPFTFAVYGDTMRSDTSFNKDHQSVINSILSYTNPQFILHLGDLVNNPKSNNDWKNFFFIENKLLRHTPIYPVHGMNEAANKGVSDYFVLPNNELWYSFNWGGCHFIALDIWDSRSNYIKKMFSRESEQYRWFINDLKSKRNTNAHFTIVFLHQPVYLYNGGDNEELKKVLTPLFKKYSVDAVFSSKHLFEHSEHEGIRYIVTGGGGAEIFTHFSKFGTPCIDSVLKFHHCRVSVNFPVMIIEAISPEGTILSSLSIEKRFEEIEF